MQLQAKEFGDPINPFSGRERERERGGKRRKKEKS